MTLGIPKITVPVEYSVVFRRGIMVLCCFQTYSTSVASVLLVNTWLTGGVLSRSHVGKQYCRDFSTYWIEGWLISRTQLT